MGIALDIILVLIVLICIFLAVKKGFVRSLIEVVGYILAIVIAFSVSGMAADYIYDNIIGEKVVETISAAVEENSEAALEALPDYITVLLDKTNFNLEALLSNGNENAVNVAQQVSDNMLKPLVVGILKTIISVVIFLILMIVVKLLAKVMNSLFTGAVLGTANKILGVSLGLVKGLVFATVFCMIVYFITTISNTEFLIFTNDAINESFLTKNVIELIVDKF